MKKLFKGVTGLMIGILIISATFMVTAKVLDRPVAYVNENKVCEKAEVVKNGHMVTLDDCPAGWERFHQEDILSEERQREIQTGWLTTEQHGVYEDGTVLYTKPN
jgi:hypothetical protein